MIWGTNHLQFNFGLGFLGVKRDQDICPLGDDIEAIEMCDHVSPRTKLLDMYIVCTSERKVFCEEELNVYNEDLDHTSLLGWWIDDVEEGEPNHEEDDVDENLNDVFGFGNDDLVDDDGRNDEALIRDGHKLTYHTDEFHYLECSISITNKGIEINYPKIQEDLVAIHLSGNKFEGNIPEFIGKLKGLRLLNISNNFFTGCSPLSFGNLTALESLDLSQNHLSGEIPQQLSQLFFLEKFNVSHNNLTGRIPGGTQLSTFDVTSFEGNPGLCGDPLPKKCENPEGINLSPSITNPEGSGIEVDWKFALAGLGSGLVVGVVLADVAITRWDEWFLEIVDMLIRLVKRMRRFRK
uniref:receptor-like protein 12 n=1 Tax=Fragaria vesca subsp. vesca TaxID=101020 RepID=UPI0005C923D9|nr:PREDICTED: receptor-like protein 12 [Fragaria vesca subsp. vesca]